MKNFLRRGVFAAAVSLASVPAMASNDVRENGAWQFRSSADKANLAAVEDMVRRKKSGYYAAPVYTTNIDRQYNCSISAAANGNEGTTSAVANSPSTSGANASSIGNSNGTSIDGSGYDLGGTASNSNDQSNRGSVGSSVRGSTNSNVRGNATQALNSTQSNTGNQSASVQGASGCSFAGPLN